mmetsp:Transcript_66113/g.117426  ORF Transcript_66113/g.117426 Transcript_66113/m.117426 type:complete len:81 (+) Transcript_66113:253-495(+)
MSTGLALAAHLLASLANFDPGLGQVSNVSPWDQAQNLGTWGAAMKVIHPGTSKRWKTGFTLLVSCQLGQLAVSSGGSNGV